MKTVHERNMISSFSSIFTSLDLNVKIVVTRLSKRNFGERKKKKILERLTLRKIEKKKNTFIGLKDDNKSKQRGKRRCNFYNDSSRRRFRRKYRTNRELERNRIRRRSINVSKNRSCNTCDESKARSLGADRIEILSDLVEVE